MEKRTRSMTAAEHHIEGFGDDLAQTLGAARRQAESWLSQKHQIARQLEGIRETAASLLDRLGHTSKDATPGQSGRTPARPAGSNVRQVTIVTGQSNSLRKPRTISDEGRARIAEAQRRRWAAQKAEQNR